MVIDNQWRGRISVNPSVHHGDPCIAGTRVPVSVLVGSIADGDSFEQILASYPQIRLEDIQAAIEFDSSAASDS